MPLKHAEISTPIKKYEIAQSKYTRKTGIAVLGICQKQATLTPFEHKIQFKIPIAKKIKPKIKALFVQTVFNSLLILEKNFENIDIFFKKPPHNKI
jgi:hypothetical protein